MKHLVKNISILGFSILFILLSIKSSYAEDAYILDSVTATTNKTVELELNEKLSRNFNDSDLEIYKSIENSALKDEEDNKIILNLDSEIEKNTSYSLISLSTINGDIMFSTGDEILGEEIKNIGLDSNSEGIKSILIKDSKTIIINFIQDINSNDFEFKFLKTLKVKSIFTIKDSNKIKATLDSKMSNNEEYLSTITYFQTRELDKIEITEGVKYFTTKELEEYTGPSDDEIAEEDLYNNNSSLEDSLMNALNESEEGNLSDSEKELNAELNSAADDPSNNEKSQLEELALSQKETPDTGAETWIILLATFIINTFYYYSRRKQSI